MKELLDEQEVIRRFFKPLSQRAPTPCTDFLKDDGAQLPSLQQDQVWVVSTDQIVEKIHFIGDESAFDMAVKLLAVNLSDIAAMAAEPFGMVLQLALPKETDADWFRDFCKGLEEMIDRYGLHLLGGDLSSLPHGKVLGATIFGIGKKKAIPHRAKAEAGDCLAVTGTIGDAVFGLACLRGALSFLDPREKDFLINRYRRPSPRVNAGLGASSLIRASLDVSDGVLDDAKKLCVSAELACRINIDALPLSPVARKIIDKDPKQLAVALCGGDDYELMMAVPPQKLAALQAKLKPLAVTHIGTLSQGKGVEIFNQQGEKQEIKEMPFSHFLIKEF